MKDFIEMLMDLWTDGWGGKACLLAVILIAALIPLGIWAAIKDEQQWAKFKVDHKCHVVSYQPSTVSTGISMDGKGTMTTIVNPEKTGWLCDDGVTYIR